MKKLLLWLVMVVVMLAVLLGGAGYAMYAMTGDDKLPTQHPTLGDTELEPIGYDWSVPVLGNVLNRTFEQPSTLTVQKLGEMTEAAPELVLPDWAQRTTLTLKDSAGSVVVQGDAAAFAMYAYPKNGSYELTLTAYRNTADPGEATGWYRYCASYTMNIQPKAVLSSERVSQGGLTSTVVDAKIVVRRALDEQSTALILYHNHPSGNLRPSKQDDLLTQKLRAAAKLFDIEVLDHIIVTRGGYYSYLVENRFDEVDKMK